MADLDWTLRGLQHTRNNCLENPAPVIVLKIKIIYSLQFTKSFDLLYLIKSYLKFSITTEGKTSLSHSTPSSLFASLSSFGLWNAYFGPKDMNYPKRHQGSQQMGNCLLRWEWALDCRQEPLTHVPWPYLQTPVQFSHSVLSDSLRPHGL